MSDISHKFHNFLLKLLTNSIPKWVHGYCKMKLLQEIFRLKKQR